MSFLSSLSKGSVSSKSPREVVAATGSGDVQLYAADWFQLAPANDNNDDDFYQGEERSINDIMRTPSLNLEKDFFGSSSHCEGDVGLGEPSEGVHLGESYLLNMINEANKDESNYNGGEGSISFNDSQTPFSYCGSVDADFNQYNAPLSMGDSSRINMGRNDTANDQIIVNDEASSLSEFNYNINDKHFSMRIADDLNRRIKEQISAYNLKDLKASKVVYSKAAKKANKTIPGLQTTIEKDLGIRSSATSLASNEKYILPKIPAHQKFTSVTDWDSDTMDPDVKTCYFHVIQVIMLREASLMHLFEHVQKVDELYWKYCFRILQEVVHKRSLTSTSLVVRRNKLMEMQNEMSLIIAHYRGITISVIETISIWRRALRRDKKRPGTSSIFWKDENYLCKMEHDAEPLAGYACIRLWLGFVPNTFMQPLAEPSSEDGIGGGVGNGPAAVWQRAYSRYIGWLRRHREFQYAEKKRLQSLNVHDASIISPPSAAIERRCDLVNSPVEEPSEHHIPTDTIAGTSIEKEVVVAEREVVVAVEAAAVLGAAEVIATRASFASLVSDLDDDLPLPSSVDYAAPGAGLDTIQSQKREEPGPVKRGWRYMRRVCVRAWGFDGDRFDSASYDEEIESAFWADLQHHPIMVEAAVGLESTFPRMVLVSQLPPALSIRCQRCSDFMRKETAIYIQLAETLVRSQSAKEEMAAYDPAEAIEDITRGRKYYDSWQEHERLRQRQQTERGQVNGSIVNYLKHMYPDVALSSSNKGERPFDLFEMTAADTPDMRSTRAPAVGFMRVDLNRLMKTLIERIEQTRNIVERVSDGSLQIRAGPNPIRDRRPKHITNSDHRNRSAHLIQNIIRRFLAYRRVNHLRIKRRRETSAIHIQMVIRGFLGRRRFRRSKKIFKTETFFLRKQVLKRSESRGVVASFIKKKAAYNKELRESIHRERQSRRDSNVKAVVNYQTYLATLGDEAGIVLVSGSGGDVESGNNNDNDNDSNINGNAMSSDDYNKSSGKFPQLLVSNEDEEVEMAILCKVNSASGEEAAAEEKAEAAAPADSTFQFTASLVPTPARSSIGRVVEGDATVRSLKIDPRSSNPLVIAAFEQRRLKAIAMKNLRITMKSASFTHSCHIVPPEPNKNDQGAAAAAAASNDDDAEQSLSYRRFAVLRERSFMPYSKAVSLSAADAPAPYIKNPNDAYIPPVHERRRMEQELRKQQRQQRRPSREDGEAVAELPPVEIRKGARSKMSTLLLKTLYL